MQNPVPLILLFAILCVAMWLSSRGGTGPRRW
jgi:hypothetical protein